MDLLRWRIHYWLACKFGQRIEWKGPVVFGVGYLLNERIWFKPPDIETRN